MRTKNERLYCKSFPPRSRNALRLAAAAANLGLSETYVVHKSISHHTDVYPQIAKRQMATNLGNFHTLIDSLLVS